MNNTRDVLAYFSVDEATEMLAAASVCKLNMETVMNCFSGVNTPPGEQTLLESIKLLHQSRPAFAVYTCPPITFCIECCENGDDTYSNTLIFIHTHCIPVAAGRNGNGTVVQIKYCPGDLQKVASKLTMWTKCRLLYSKGGGKFQSMAIITQV